MRRRLKGKLQIQGRRGVARPPGASVLGLDAAKIVRAVEHMRFIIVAAAALLVSCSQEAPAPEPAALAPVDAVIAAERAMAAEARRTGWVEANEASLAPGAILLQSGPTDAAAFYANIHPDNRGDTSLTWGPDFAGASASGDFGFTAGPFNGDGAVFGYSLHVWERQPDGAWKWIYGDGVDTGALTVDPQGVATIAPGAEATDPAIDIAAAEQALAARALTDASGAIVDVLAAEGRVSRSNLAPVVGPDAARGLLANAPLVRYAPPLRTVVRPDMAFTLGEASWDGGAGYYARIWVLADDGWTLAFDQLLLR